jgi:glycosyltransferase involved in cell wall biosynthesis
VSCSRDDSFSLVSVEAAQFSKPCIFSDNVGAREVLDGSCSFVFPSGDVKQLRQIMIQAYMDRASLKNLGRTARKIYEERLTEQCFSRSFLKLVDDNIA